MVQDKNHQQDFIMTVCKSLLSRSYRRVGTHHEHQSTPLRMMLCDIVNTVITIMDLPEAKNDQLVLLWPLQVIL